MYGSTFLQGYTASFIHCSVLAKDVDNNGKVNYAIDNATLETCWSPATREGEGDKEKVVEVGEAELLLKENRK